MIDIQGRIAILVLTLPGAASARADFRVSGRSQPAVVSDSPHISPGDHRENRANSLRKRLQRSTIYAGARSRSYGPAAVGSSIVRGFGDAVPLAFACGQIVPKTIRIIYGAGADPTTLVTWQGGQPWAAVMRKALQPVGLRLVPHGSTVEITK